MRISVVSRQPPGGRCALYMRFADAIADATDGRSELLYPQPIFPFPEKPIPPAPALLVNGAPVRPEDGMLLTPGEVCAAVVAAGFDGDTAALRRRLEKEWEALAGSLG